MIAPGHIFPTSHREKIGKDFAFALGAEALSQALAGVPQHGLLTCSFFGSQDHGLKRVERLLVMQVSYTKRDRAFHDAQSANELGVFDPRWQIIMRTIPVVDRATVKPLLLETGLPDLVKPWLESEADITGRTGQAFIDIVYVRETEALASEARLALGPLR